MKKNVTLKLLIILIIIAVCLISFIGIYKKDKEQITNIIPQYMLAMDLSGVREVELAVSEDTKEIIYDTDGNVTTDGLDDSGNLKEGYTKQNEKINKDELLTKENYEKTKQIIEKRLKALNVTSYQVRKNSENGKITVLLSEDENTDEIVSNLAYKGKFDIEDSQTGDVLITNSDIKKAKAVYGNNDTGTVVYLVIEFNKDGKKKFEEITKTYITSNDEDGNSTTKNVSIKLDDTQLLETYFDRVITDGILQLSIGSATTSNEEISNYIKKASEVAALITNQKMELQYEVENNTYIASEISTDTIRNIIIVISIITIIAFIFLIVKYKTNAVFASIAYIGFVAVYLLVLRYTNVIISLEGIMGIVIVLISNYLFNNYILKKLVKTEETLEQIIKQAFIKHIWVLLPLLIIAITFTFMNWTQVASIGMVMFWGLVLIFIYNYIITKTLLDS